LSEVAVFERAHMLGDNTVEAAHLFNLMLVHSLTLVREQEVGNRSFTLAPLNVTAHSATRQERDREFGTPIC
jgi:hypothetical protein